MSICLSKINMHWNHTNSQQFGSIDRMNSHVYLVKVCLFVFWQLLSTSHNTFSQFKCRLATVDGAVFISRVKCTNHSRKNIEFFHIKFNIRFRLLLFSSQDTACNQVIFLIPIKSKGLIRIDCHFAVRMNGTFIKQTPCHVIDNDNCALKISLETQKQSSTHINTHGTHTCRVLLCAHRVDLFLTLTRKHLLPSRSCISRVLHWMCNRFLYTYIQFIRALHSPISSDCWLFESSPFILRFRFEMCFSLWHATCIGKVSNNISTHFQQSQYRITPHTKKIENEKIYEENWLINRIKKNP